MQTSHPDRRPGDDWSLHSLYDLVPDAYELDLLEEARRPVPEDLELDLEAARRAAIASLGYDGAVDGDESVGAPSPAQAQFMVERLLGGEILDEPRS